MLELRRVSVLTSTTVQTQESIHRGSNDSELALSTRMDRQYQDLSYRLDTLGKLILSAQLEDTSRCDPLSSRPAQNGTNGQTLRVVTSHRIPCRGWCPCSCHEVRRLKLRMAGIVENVLGKMFVGYCGLPVLNKPCDFKACRDRQNTTATVEYWFPSWFVSMNVKLHLTYLPSMGPQFQLSTTRRVPDDSQAISFAMQGNIDGLKYLFSQGLAGPRDVSDSRGFTLMRVSLRSTILITTILTVLLVGAVRRDAQS